MTLALIVSSSLFILIAVLILLTEYFLYRGIFKRKFIEADPYWGFEKEKYNDYRDTCIGLVDKLMEKPYETFQITSHDGLKLFARYYHIKDGAPLEIQCHGYKSTPMRDLSGGGNEAVARGHNLLLIFQRAHSESEGNVISMGENERLDLVRWINFMIEKLGSEVKIVLSGVSMGASTVLLASELDLPDNVKGIIADCPYSSTKDIICAVAKNKHLPGKFLYPLIRAGARRFGKFDPDAHSAKEAVKKAKIPILLIHGTEDTFVPYKMSEEIFKNCSSEKRIELFEGAEHGLSYIKDTKKYQKIISEFLEKIL